jgi:hypothetical protein
LLDVHAQVIASIPQVGGQCAKLYQGKPIDDISALPMRGALELQHHDLTVEAARICTSKPGIHAVGDITPIRARKN